MDGAQARRVAGGCAAGEYSWGQAPVTADSRRALLQNGFCNLDSLKITGGQDENVSSQQVFL